MPDHNVIRVSTIRNLGITYDISCSYREGVPMCFKNVRDCSPNCSKFFGILVLWKSGKAIWNPHQVGLSLLLEG